MCLQHSGNIQPFLHPHQAHTILEIKGVAGRREEKEVNSGCLMLGGTASMWPQHPCTQPQGHHQVLASQGRRSWCGRTAGCPRSPPGSVGTPSASSSCSPAPGCWVLSSQGQQPMDRCPHEIPLQGQTDTGSLSLQGRMQRGCLEVRKEDQSLQALPE